MSTALGSFGSAGASRVGGSFRAHSWGSRRRRRRARCCAIRHACLPRAGLRSVWSRGRPASAAEVSLRLHTALHLLDIDEEAHIQVALGHGPGERREHLLGVIESVARGRVMAYLFPSTIFISSGKENMAAFWPLAGRTFRMRPFSSKERRRRRAVGAGISAASMKSVLLKIGR